MLSKKNIKKHNTSNYRVWFVSALLFGVQMVYSQTNEKNFAINFTNTPLKEILEVIEKKWDVVFVYNTSEINDKMLVTTNIQNSNLNVTLNRLLSPLKIGFKLNDYFVYLSSTKAETNLKISESHIRISGKVIDDFKQPLQGVYVINQSKNLKAISDENGNFRFLKTEKDSVLSLVLLGYRTQKITEIKDTVLMIVMRSNTFLLNDLVVVGYGSLKTKEITGAIASLPQYILNNVLGGDIGSGIQGNVAGVYATNDRFRVRGVSSINSVADPLLVVDGVPQSLTLKDLNPDDIESVEFLKDAVSGAIYGSRASNGVILVTTKSGDFDMPSKLTVNLKSGFNYLINQPAFLTGSDLLKVIDDAYFNRYPDKKLLSDTDPLKYFPFSSDYANFKGYNRNWLNSYLQQQPAGTDWLREVSQPMLYNEFRVALQGGQSQNKYLLSLSYRSNKDFIKEKTTERITLLFKNDYNISKFIKAGISSNFVINLWNNATYTAANTLFNRSSLLPVYAPDGSGSLFDARNINDKKGENPLYRMNETWDDNIDLNGILTAYTEVRFLRNFTFRSDWSFIPGTRRYRYFQSKDFYREDEAIDPTKSGIILYARTLNYSINGNNVLNYTADLSRRHKLKLMLGNNIQSFNSDFNVARYEGFPTDYFELTNANTEKVYTRQSAGMDGYRFLSFFNRSQYAYDDKWFVELNARADATSRFTPQNRWGFFPGLGISWLASSEEFIKNIETIDYLKLRAGYGYVGNAEVGNFPAESRVLNWAEYAGSPGFVFDRIANSDVRWEKQRQLNIGLNVSLFKNRSSATLDFFYKRNEDLLINYNIGTFQGYINTDVTVNSGIMNIKGFDFNIITDNLQTSLKWKTEFNISHFSSKVVQLSAQQPFIEKGVNRVYSGYPLALYYLPLWAGVDPETGHELIYEVAGADPNKTKTGNTLDAELLTATEYRNQRVLITDKTPYPTIYGGINNLFTYNNWTFSFLFSFQMGNWLYHTGMRQNSYVSTYDIQNKLKSVAGYWTPTNKQSQIPMLYNSIMSGRESTRYLVDGSYLRLRNVLIKYSLPNNMAAKIYAKSINIQLQAQNLLTFSKFKNGDPEVSGGTAGADANIKHGNVGLNSGIATLNFGLSVVF